MLDKRNLRDHKRRLLAAKYELRRKLSKAFCQDPDLPSDMRDKYRSKLSKLPRKSSFARVRNRCISTGRPRGVLEFFRISRLVFRGLASRESGYMAFDSLDEIRENKRNVREAFQERIKRHYEKLVKPRMFTVGDLVHAPPYCSPALSGAFTGKATIFFFHAIPNPLKKELQLTNQTLHEPCGLVV
ncbi:hypothetical protein KSP39_PZI009271 [Platanthera zijinensis]|uniref:Small ribosomal subunit protein uS14m n=1 Tax=Platanthera zijinensis TaxID=2320716 RepID=A0AAP0G7P7_9ASPA